MIAINTRHSSPPPPAPSSGPGPGDPASPRSVQKENSPPRGPRTLLLRRSENGYGFTLRHFIVYPPESCCMLPGHERTKVDEPMDTIFVKQVRANSPAAEAGLRTGDRVVSVDGTPTRGEQYASVVQRIQQAGPWLRLLVVSKEDDILQRYFGDTAHNPETNQRPRLRSPERLSQKQRKSMSSMIPGGSPRTRQSWVCSLPSSESPNHQEEAMCRMSPSTMSQFPIMESQIANALQQQKQQQRRGISEASALYDLSEDSRVPGRKLQLLREDNVQPSGRLSLDSKYDLYDRTRPESVYSRPSNEQLYDRINDPIYERVRVSEHHPQHYYQPSLLRYPVSQAEPQVPIYRPIKRMVARRASEGSGNIDSEMASYGSIDALRSSESSRLSMESRRDSSPAASKDSMSPYDSNSTLTGNECSDDSVIMNRLRKSFEQKAEFLRRPSYPVGWSVEPSLLPNIDQSAVIQREFYARPQKLQRQIWPPGQNEQQQRQQSPTRRSQERNIVTKTVTSLNKPSNQSVQRIKDVDSNSEYSKPRNDQQLGDNQSVAGDHCYSPSLLYDNELAKEQQYRGAGKGSFVSILSRIHENISTNQQQTSQETRNGSSSLPSSPGPDKKAGNDRFPVPPQGLQIVSRRAKQFESGRLLSDEDEPAGDRTNLYKSELSRLSNKRTLTGNRIIPIGSKHIHCEPPADYKESKDVPTMETESVRLRARSNSAESWEATNGPAARSNARHTWQTAEEEGSTEDNNKAYRNQDNYLQSAKLQIAPVNGSSPNASTNNAAVLRRQKNAQISDEDRATRRVSYLKATWGERMHVDSDLELSDSEPVHIHRNNSIAVTSNSCDETAKDAEPVEREGTLHVKFTVLDGKRSTDRSWKQVWGVLRGPIIYFYKDRHSQSLQSPSLSTESETNAGQSVDVRCSVVDVAEDYTKRKHVLRVANPTAEVLLQTEDAASMALWLRSLHSHAAAERSSDAISCTSKQQAVPQTPTGPTTPNSGVPPNNVQRLSPLPSHKGIKKLTSFRNRSPTGQSPVNKTRKPSNQMVEPLPSPKSKTWKGRMAKQFRRMHGQAGGAPSSPTAQSPPEGATFKVPLEICPASSFSEYVPLIVEMCTSIVEARGLEVVGIYRVPGNTAAIGQLTDNVNRGFENINFQVSYLIEPPRWDPKWSDVNVISSLLKSFFRQLPDSLLTADLYPMFIDADKIEDPQRRMTTIRKLLRDLPEHHFETLKYLMQHLKKIVEHSEINKMEAKNLAIVFGPTLVRASGSRDNMVTMVTDMSHQCRIVESLLNNVDWFFSEDDLDDLSRLSVNLSLPTDSCEVEPASNHSLLLNNIQKIEGMRDMASAKDIVSSIISAANKKIQRRRKNQDEIDNSEHDNDKVKLKQESENLQTIRRQSMALNERQCSVSEIVQMHESKSQPNHSTDRSLSVDSNNSGSSHGTCSSSRTKYAFQSAPPSVDSTRLSIDTGLSSAETGSTVSSNASNQTKQSNDEIAILTYAGLSATTQERVRRFEEETKAMLQRDQHRQRLEAEKREEERRRIEIEWQLAKREMENDDLLDSIVDTTVSPSLLSERLSSLNERLADKSLIDLSERHGRSRSTTRPPLSIAVQQQPMMHQKAQATNQLTSILGEKMNNGVIKKFKTDKDPSMESICLPPVRYGSLDSLHEVHNLSQSSPSPSQQQRGVPGDGSDDASAGFWWYISSHLYGTASPGGTAAKTPTQSPMSMPVPVTAVPMPMPVPVSVPAAAAAGATTAAAAAAASSLATAVASAATTASSANNEPATAKTLNRFLRGSDLLTTLTTTFDRKWRSLINQSSNQAQPPPESASCNKNDITEQQEQKQKPSASPRTKYPSTEAYRDPSLHKSLDKSHLARPKDDAPEKDTDSTVADNIPHPSESITPNNDRGANDKQRLETKPMTNNATENEGQKDVDEGDDCLRAGNPKRYELSSEKELQESKSENNDVSAKVEDNSRSHHYYETGDSSYSNKLKKFESLTNSQARSRLKRSESLNKRTCENTTSRLKRSESLNKHSTERLSPLKRSESLNKHSGDRSESPGSKLKRSESLTKTEKTECNISKRRQSVRKESATKLKRKNGMSERSIKRRHTVGSTKDFDKVHWLDNKLQSEAERVIRSDYRPKKSQLRTSSPDLSTNRVGMADTSFLIEVSFRGPSNVVFNVTNAARPQSLPDASLASKVFKVPLESHMCIRDRINTVRYVQQRGILRSDRVRNLLPILSFSAHFNPLNQRLNVSLRKTEPSFLRTIKRRDHTSIGVSLSFVSRRIVLVVDCEPYGDMQ
ncbi:Rho GTPase-activating protein 21 [Temnothorax longispinosus]|uniref:Rho GTPase-activating protein 21 n=1 Tax=Temnothorax longispinosus TaxID=300112 RepID=A0A4S2LAX6_9HYME|nr:Rho GTPase-activating protein 21 [Temnothorax longispinosus]